jgi:hypothetical protein
VVRGGPLGGAGGIHLVDRWMRGPSSGGGYLVWVH